MMRKPIKQKGVESDIESISVQIHKKNFVSYHYELDIKDRAMFNIAEPVPFKNDKGILCLEKDSKSQIEINSFIKQGFMYCKVKDLPKTQRRR